MNLLKATREQKGLSRAELARTIGATERYIGFLETGQRVPSLPMAIKISRALSMSVDKLFCN